MSNPKRNELAKPASRLTLADLFGPGPLPAPSEIKTLAKSLAKNTTRKIRKEARPTAEHTARLASIRAAALACHSSPEWTKHWHTTARLLIIEHRTCVNCRTLYASPGADGWLVEYTNSRNGATQAYSPAGPIDARLPIKEFIHESVVHVCQACAHKQTTIPLTPATQLLLPAPTKNTSEKIL